MLFGSYREVYRHLGVEYQIAAGVSGGPGHVTALAISRKLRDFTERERALLQHLQPQLTLAFQNLLAAGGVKSQLDEATAALKALGSSAVVIDAAGKILRCEEPSRQRLTDYFGRVPGHLLPGEVQRWVVERLASGPRIKPLPGCFSRVGPRGTLTLRIAPLRLPEEWLLILSEAAAQNMEARLRPLGFSRRQSEVVRWLLDGKTNSEIGTILGISSRTVQKHLEHLFADLGVETRTAAAARIRERLAASGEGDW
jgi:DNA-binding CsgD family transcriptional regulator